MFAMRDVILLNTWRNEAYQQKETSKNYTVKINEISFTQDANRIQESPHKVIARNFFSLNRKRKCEKKKNGNEKKRKVALFYSRGRVEYRTRPRVLNLRRATNFQCLLLTLCHSWEPMRIIVVGFCQGRVPTSRYELPS